MNIFFCVNTYAMEGLGASLISLIRNCSNTEKLKIWILCDQLPNNDIENIKKLLIFENYKGIAEFVDVDTEKEFHNLKAFKGNKATYGRFLIPSILETGNAFYLDSDIVVKIDILELQNFISDKVIGAVEYFKFYNAMEKDFLVKKLRFKPETSYFNAGMLVINIDQWHIENISEKLTEIGNRYYNELVLADQTALNILFINNYNQIPKRFNTRFKFFENYTETEKALIHFAGSIKPWDILGNKIHNGYEYWNVYQTLFWKNSYKKITCNKLIKVWELKRLYATRVLLMLPKPIAVLYRLIFKRKLPKK